MASTRNYELRLFDQTLVEFSITSGEFGPEVKLNEYDEAARKLMPCGLALTPEGIWNWLETRSIPTNRRNAARICHELGFTLGDTEALYKTSLGLSLNDSYWVVPQGFAGKFEEYNLFENSFSEAIGALAVAGEPRGGSLKGNTPELTTDGTLRKGWRIVNNKRVLYKGASEGFVPGEPWSEYLAGLMANNLGLNAVSYGLDEWEGQTCSTCENFATKDISYVPFAVATGLANLPGAIWWCAKLGSSHLEALCNMLAFDALACNTDRHLANFGVLRDNHTGEALGLAPIFDNGRALFPNVSESDAAQFTLEAQLRTPAFGGNSFQEQLAHFIGRQQKTLFAQAAERGIVGNTLLPGERVDALDIYVRRRAEELSKIAEVDHEQLVEQLEGAIGKWEPANENVIRLRNS